MTDDSLTSPALLAHVFLADDGRDGWARLRSLWTAAISQFGLDRTVGALAVPRDLTDDPADSGDGRGLLAAAESTADSVWQALAWKNHDVLCLTAMLAPPASTDCARAWSDLERGWEHVLSTAIPGRELGQARTFLALSAGGDDLELVRESAPQPSQPGWWQHWDSLSLGGPGGDEIRVWETGPDLDDARTLRRIMAVAPAGSERRMDSLVWTSGDGIPAPLTRHLIHAARLRHQVRVFDGGRAPRQLRDELGGQGAPGIDRSRPALDAVDMRAKLVAMRHAVGIIDENMRRALDLSPHAQAVGPLSEDLQLASWFGQRLDDEVIRLEVEADRTRGAGEVIAAAREPRRARPVPSWREARPLAVVFTALEVEYVAIREYLDPPVRKLKERGTIYELGGLSGIAGSWQVVLAQTGPGSTTAGVQLDRAVPVFAPMVALYVGVAGGRKDVTLGDVVAPDRIYDYEWGKSTLEGYEPRMRNHSPSYSLLQEARHVARVDRWQRRIRPRPPDPPPRCIIKPIVTGSKVIAHDKSAVATMIDQYASDAVAVETEGHGFLEAASANAGLDALVIRGISDLLTGKHEVADNYWQPVASRHAAAFAIELLDCVGAG